MTCEPISYTEARNRMQPGDVIAFGGKSHFSEIIKLATFAPVSHVGVVLQTKIVADNTERFFNQIIESATINGFSGVSISRFSDRVADSEGELWWLPLREDIRARRFNQTAFFDFLFGQAAARVEYDTPQAIKSAIDVADNLPFGAHGPAFNKEDFSKFFCSELVAAGLEKAGAVDSLNASEVTPIDLCRWNIYQDVHYQLRGDPDKRIGRYNSVSPTD